MEKSVFLCGEGVPARGKAKEEVTKMSYQPGDIVGVAGRAGAIQIYESVKEGILYSLPLSWRTPEHTWHSKRGHCGAKAELLAFRLREHGYTVQYVVGYRVGGLPRFLRPAFLDCHIWCEVLVDGEWLVLDPTPDRVIAHLCEDTEPGTHQYRPDYIERIESISPWYKDVYNSWLILPYKVFVNAALTLYRLSR